MLVALTIERFVAVCHPAWARKNNSSARAYIAVFFIPLACLLLYVPTVFSSVLSECEDNELTIYQKRDNLLYRTSSFYRCYKWVLEVLFRVLPMVLIVSFNLIIICTYRSLCNKRRRLKVKATSKTTSLYSEERRLVYLLGGISCMFVVFVTPVTALSLYNESLHFSYWFQIFRAFCNVMEVMNYSITFYIYFMFSHEFRDTFIRMFRAFRNGESIFSVNKAASSDMMSSNRKSSTVRNMETTLNGTSSNVVMKSPVYSIYKLQSETSKIQNSITVLSE